MTASSQVTGYMAPKDKESKSDTRLPTPPIRSAARSAASSRDTSATSVRTPSLVAGQPLRLPKSLLPTTPPVNSKWRPELATRDSSVKVLFGRGITDAVDPSTANRTAALAERSDGDSTGTRSLPDTAATAPTEEEAPGRDQNFQVFNAGATDDAEVGSPTRQEGEELIVIGVDNAWKGAVLAALRQLGAPSARHRLLAVVKNLLDSEGFKDEQLNRLSQSDLAVLSLAAITCATAGKPPRPWSHRLRCSALAVAGGFVLISGAVLAVMHALLFNADAWIVDPLSYYQ